MWSEYDWGYRGTSGERKAFFLLSHNCGVDGRHVTVVNRKYLLYICTFWKKAAASACQWSFSQTGCQSYRSSFSDVNLTLFWTFSMSHQCSPWTLGSLLIGLLFEVYIVIVPFWSIICVCQEKEEQAPSTTEPYFDGSTVECAVQLCPDQLKNGELLLMAGIVFFWGSVALSHFGLWFMWWADFQCIFPEAPSPGMTVVTVTQKTLNDMTSWSFAVEQEREQMLIKVT